MNHIESTRRLRAVGSLAIVLAISAWNLRAQSAPSPEFPPPHHTLVDDMWLPDEVVWGDGVFTAAPWPSGVVPYLFATSVSSGEQHLMETAMAEVEAISQVDFVPYIPGTHANVILIRPNPNSDNVSSSAVGMAGGGQFLDIGANHWTVKYVMVHELFHALGFLHEHQRPDRDTYVTIQTSRISQTGCSGGPCNGNFTLVAGATTTGPYDFDSIMHYGQNAFSNGTGPTIVCKPSYAAHQSEIGNRGHMTSLDAQAIATRYGVPSSPTLVNVVPNSVAAGGSDSVLIVLTGTRYLEGSPTSEGVQGSVVRFNGVHLQTVFSSSTTLVALVPASMIQLPSPTNSITVENDVDAGGVSNALNFAVTAPPCPSATDSLGHAVVALGDVDGDHHDDYVVGAPQWGTTGRIWCHSGANGAVIWQLSPSGVVEFGYSLARIDDVNGDGVDDVLAGSRGIGLSSGGARLIDGATGSVLVAVTPPSGGGFIFGTEFGYAVAGLGDLSGDGIPDFAVGAPNWNPGGAVFVYSGSTGVLLRSHSEPATGFRFGSSVAGGRDVSGDGTPDYVVGAPEADVPGALDAGEVTLFSGATGAALVMRNGVGAYDFFGRSVALIPAVTASGRRASFVVGAPESGSTSGAFGGAGYVHVYRGSSTLSPYGLALTMTGPAYGSHYGYSVAHAGDADDDGSADILVGAPQVGIGVAGPVGPGFAEIRSLAGTLLATTSGTSVGSSFGSAVSGDFDTNGDAVLDVIAGAPLADVPCPDAGGYSIFHPRLVPKQDKVLITEISTGVPAGVEITNFGTGSATLTEWTLVWSNTGGFSDPATVPLPTITLQPGEIVIVKEPGGTIAELPPATQVYSVLPSLSPFVGAAVVVALRNRAGITVDEVRMAGVSNTEPGISLGGRFRGFAQNFQPGGFATNIGAQRIWGLDSNGGGDWTSAQPRTFGLENTSSGHLGFDPVPVSSIVINEIDDAPDYVEFRNRGPAGAAGAVNVEAWSILASGAQGNALGRWRPWPGSYVVPGGAYFVFGAGPLPAPPELPFGALYATAAASVPPGASWSTDEYTLALVDHLGRPVDVLRVTGHDDDVVHNHPRIPSSVRAFTGGANRGAVASGVIGRNLTSSDTNTESDWRPMTTRTLGAPNGTGPLTWVPDATPGMDVRVNATGLGGGLAIIVNAGGERAGFLWSFLWDVGHFDGQGPVFGLGPNAIANWSWSIANPPFSGPLDSRGAARVDVASGTLPPGIDVDAIFVLTDAVGNLVTYTPIIEFDT